MEESIIGKVYAKKGKLSFSINSCVFCNKKFVKHLDRTELNPAKLESLIDTCKRRNDEVSTNIVANEHKIRNGEITVCYHKECRSKFMHPFYNKEQSEVNESDLQNLPCPTPAKSTRSLFGNNDFLWKENCFICGGKCNPKNRPKWSMVEASVNERSKLYLNLLDIAMKTNDHVIQARLLSTNGDLVAAEARYHRQPQCLSKYLGKKCTADEKSNLNRACEMLKSKIQNKIEIEKCTYDFTFLRTQLIDISRENSIEIPKSMLRTYRVKEALEQVWPGLKFIAREGLSYLVCSQDVTVDEALSKTVQLEKSLHDINEQDEFESSFLESDNDREANEISVVHEAAAILRRRILKTDGLKQEYFASTEIGKAKQRDFLDSLLVRFVTWLGSASKLKDGNELDDSDIDQRTISISSDITALVKPIMTPKHLGLSIYLHHSYGSKKLIEDLHLHGYTLSYTEVRHFLTSAAIHMAQVQERTLSGGVIPAHMSGNQQERSDDLIILAADNWDHNENTLSGKQSTHAMTSIMVHSKLNEVNAIPRIARVKERSIDTVKLSGDGLAHTMVYEKPTERPNPKLSTPVRMSELSCPEPADAKQLRIHEIMYTIGRSESLFPPWTVFQSHVIADTLTEPSEIVFNPIIMAPPTELNTVYTTLKRSKEQVNALGQTICPIVFDMGLLCKALEIVWARPLEFEGVIPLEGGMHLLMSIFGGIGCLYGDAGLKNLLTESDVFARNTANHILSGKDFDRALRVIIMIDEVLCRRFLFQFYRWGQQNSQLVPVILFQKLQQLDVEAPDSGNLIQEITSLIENRMVPLLEMFRSEGRSLSPLFRFWDDYLMKVSLPLKMYLAASRHGLWSAFQYSKTLMLPFMFASNRTVYARYMPYVVLQMNRLPEVVLNAFKKGKFVAKLTNGRFNSVWIDYVLEVTENKALKSSGGIIGLTHNDGALARWFLSRPLTAKYAIEFSSAVKGPSEKHHSDTPFHKNAYNEAVANMLSLFEKEIFIDPFCLSSPPDRLVNFATGVAAEHDVATCLLDCHKTGKKMLEDFVCDRFQVEGEKTPTKKFFDPMPRAKVKTMTSGKTGSVQIKSKAVKINGEEMYLRLLAMNSYKQISLERVMSFENAPVPLSLFHDDGTMMFTKKSDFLEKLENIVEPQKILRCTQQVECILFDGMAIIQMLQQPSGTKPTYQQMAKSFWTYIINKSLQVPQVHVIFDRYDENSLKMQTRRKRGDIASCSAIKIQPNMVIGDWKRLLTSSKSKTEITKLYTRYLTENCHTLITNNKQLFVSGGLEERTLCITSDIVSYVDDLESNQEEADSRILFHLAYASATCDINSAVVVSPDTDVFVLLVHHYNSLGIQNLYFKTGRKGLYCNLTRYIPVHEVYRKLNPDERAILLSVFCITGCDTCSSFHGIGKKKAFQVLRRHSHTLANIADLGQVLEITSTVKAAAIYFVGLLYGHSHCTSLNMLRKDLVLSKAQVKPRRLPPTNDSLMLHLLRCAYQLFIWKHALNPQPDPNPLDYGYVIDDQGMYEPHLMSQPCAPPELLSDMVCVCEDHCSNECVCQSNEQPCTTACSCRSSLQDNEELCQNLFTMLANITSDDETDD